MTEERVLDLSACALRSYEIPEEWRDSLQSARPFSVDGPSVLEWVTTALVSGVTTWSDPNDDDARPSVVCVVLVNNERPFAVRAIKHEPEWRYVQKTRPDHYERTREIRRWWQRKPRQVTVRIWQSPSYTSRETIEGAWSLNNERERAAIREVAEWVDARR